MPSRKPLLVALSIVLIALVVAIPSAGPELLNAGTDATTVTIVDEDGDRLGTVAVTVADTPVERYRGLSDTESLAPDEGMLFVFEEERERTFVMRDMAYPLDIVFVGSDGTITTIHTAPVEEDANLTAYTGRARWVLEVNAGWTDEHEVEVGDRILIDGEAP
ncbi:MAG: DUF192 domain-containing protein [Halanaeroarchaeum sp.]